MEQDKKRKIRIYTIVSLIVVVFGCASSSAQTYISASNVEYTDNSSLGASNVQDALDKICIKFDNQLSDKINALYPVDSIYITTAESSSNSVKEKFSKLGLDTEWEEYSTGKELVSADGKTYIVNKSGGSLNKKIEISASNVKGTVSSYSGNSGGTAISLEQTPKGLARHTIVSGGAWSLGLWGGHGDGNVVTMSDQTGYGTYGQAHSHTINHGHTFSGTAVTLNQDIQDDYVVVYMYKRTK